MLLLTNVPLLEPIFRYILRVVYTSAQPFSGRGETGQPSTKKDVIMKPTNHRPYAPPH